MKETYSIYELMEMHTHFSNKIIKQIDKNKRFKHDPIDKIIICEIKYLWTWKRKSHETYQEILLSDFGVH